MSCGKGAKWTNSGSAGKKTTFLDETNHAAVSLLPKKEDLWKTGVMADRDKIEFRLFNSSSIFNITLREELFSSPKQTQPCCLVLVSWR